MFCCLHNQISFQFESVTQNFDFCIILGLDYSQDPFYNHVFLEHHLDPWCPSSGPVRQFMESICQGLSQNPYMASQKKIDTILWFKTYFERPENHEILVHSGCWEDSENVEEANN